MKVTGAAVNSRCEIVETRLFLTVLDETARFGDESRVFSIDLKAVGVAALAGPETRGLRVLERIVQLYVLRIGGAGWTGRTAIDSRRRH
jgi:hypothetical protein